MNFEELKSFFDSCPHLISIDENSLYEASKDDIIGKDEFCYTNMLTGQHFSIFKDKDGTPTCYLSLNFPHDWLSLKEHQLQNLINVVTLQNEEMMSFNKKTLRKTL